MRPLREGVPVAVEVRPTIDRQWLERAELAEPLTHAYALWDLERTPQVVRFVSAMRGEETVGYLLVWLGLRGRPVVHWFGGPDVTEVLLEALPTPPFIAVVPPEVEPVVVAAFPASRPSRLKMMLREPGGLRVQRAAVRRLGREDRPALAELVRAYGELELGGYEDLDPEEEPVWGLLEGSRLVGVARAAVRLPRVWVLGGVFVVPARRGHGLGRALVSAAVEEAEHSGARAGLYVRDEPAPALRLYEELGFHEVGRRSWLDVPPRRSP